VSRIPEEFYELFAAIREEPEPPPVKKCVTNTWKNEIEKEEEE